MTIVLPSFVQPYTRLKVAANQWASINIDGIRYDFEYQPSAGYIAQSDGQRQVGGFSADVGKQIEWRGIEITVSEVQSDYAILLIKSL
jgi:hypothetical protein